MQLFTLILMLVFLVVYGMVKSDLFPILNLSFSLHFFILLSSATFMFPLLPLFLLLLPPPPPPRGGGGGTSVCMHIGYVPCERPPFSALNFHSGAYHFHKLPKNLFRSITILHFLADFAVPETIIFKMSLISTRSSPPTAGHRLAAGQSASQTRPGSSGDLHFHAQNGSSSFRSPAFSSSKRLKLVRSPAFSRSTGSLFWSPGPFFTLPRHIPTKIWGEYPPPPPRLLPLILLHPVVLSSISLPFLH